MNSLKPIQNLLICPVCRNGLQIKQQYIICTNCKRIYPLYDNIPQFAVYKDDKDVLTEASEISTNNYEHRYEDFERARNYNLKYERKLFKRLSTWREYQILQHLLGRQKHCATMLEIPCGGGRISPRLANATDLLIQADIGLGQILYGMTRSKLDIPQIWMTASAFHIPMQDNSVDAAVCIRLSHHLQTVIQREALLAELLRVARRYVVMTFFDFHSIKNLLRRLRRSKPKLTMTVSQVASITARHDAKLAACPWLSAIGSGHRYALLVKTRH